LYVSRSVNFWIPNNPTPPALQRAEDSTLNNQDPCNHTGKFLFALSSSNRCIPFQLTSPSCLRKRLLRSIQCVTFMRRMCCTSSCSFWSSFLVVKTNLSSTWNSNAELNSPGLYTNSNHYKPTSKSNRALKLSRIFYRKVKQGVLQFVLIKPVTAVIAILLDKYGLYNDGNYDYRTGFLYLSLINNFSVSLSLYCLALFYMATEERLKPFSPFYKFLTVKAILFFSFWQASLFQMLNYAGIL